MKIILLFIAALIGSRCICQDIKPEIKSRLVLIGNVDPDEESSQQVMRVALKAFPQDDITRFVFFGYHTDTAFSSNSTDKNKSPLIFIPGAKEWNNGMKVGLDSLLALQTNLQKHFDDKDILLPKDGCPGPEEIKLGDEAVLVLINTQWWLHAFKKTGLESDCPTRSREQVYDELDKIIRENENKLLIIAGYHPLESKGVHGNHYSLKQHVFPLTDIHPSLYIPLPVLGSLYPIIRNALPSRQNLKHPEYKLMIKEIKTALESHPFVLYVSAHENNLQLLQDENMTYLISGAAGETHRASRSKQTLFAESATGFAVIDIMENKKASISFYDGSKYPAPLLYSNEVIDFSQREPLIDTVSTYKNVGEQDSIIVAASDQYSDPSKATIFLMGNNYRSVWSTPVKVPIFDIQKEGGGFEVRKVGGGMQTKTLHLEDSSGNHFKLRTIDKNNETLLPEKFRTPFTKSFVQDFASAAHPYAPLVVADLAKKLGVVESNPRYFFVPRDTALGYYHTLFANKMVMLEDKDPLPFDNTNSTMDIMNKITDKADHVVDQEIVLKARLLDVLIGDFDRHMGQWSWGKQDTGKGKLYEPVPKDRDQAFFNSTGLVVRLLGATVTDRFKGFKKDLKNLEGLGFQSEKFDRTFLNSLDKDDWENIITQFQATLPDAAIDDAVKKLPPEIYAISGNEIADKLKTRRKNLVEKGLDYYRFISDYVNIPGSNQNEYFLLTQSDNQLMVQVYEWKDGDTVMQTYSRTFDPEVTEEVRLYGLNGDDYFFADSSVQNSIRIRMIGGQGKDSFMVQGPGAIYIYDYKPEQNFLLPGSYTKNRMSNKTTVNDYRLNSFSYADKGSFPKFDLLANSEYGPLPGIGLSKITYSFNKEPFATSNKIMVYYAPYRKSYQVTYQGIFNQLFKDFGLKVDAALKDDAIMNFFGLGNESTWDKSRNYSYYRIRYNYAAADMLVTKNYFSDFSMGAGFSLYHYWYNNENNIGKIIATPATSGLDTFSVNTTKTFLGGKLQANVQTLDNRSFPKQGVQWNNELSYLNQVNNDHSIFYFRSDLLLAANLVDTSKLISLIKLGGGHIFNNRFDYFQSMGFGNENNLRGFRNNRFLGRSSVYGSMELRYRLLSPNSFTIPGDLGILAFGDLGRVWMPGSPSDKWHNAYGGGIYFYPFERMLITASIGQNEDGAIYNFSIGSTINWHQ